MTLDQSWQIAPASPEDVQALSELAFRAKSHWGYPAEWLDQWRVQLTVSLATLRDQRVFVARRQSQAIGFYSLLLEGKYASLEHLWVDPPFHGHGVGAGLFRHALAEAQRDGCEELLIDSDPNAEAFYLRMGAAQHSHVLAPVAGVDRWLPRLCVSLRAGDG